MSSSVLRTVFLVVVGFPLTAIGQGKILLIDEVKDFIRPACVPASLLKQFDHFEYRGPLLEDNQTITFRLHRPDLSAQSTGKFPLLVWLHGYGECGDDNISQLRWLEMVLNGDSAVAENLFILAIQRPSQNSSNAELKILGGQDWVNLEIAILKQILEKMPIDPSRVYLSGVSSGGSRCWQMAGRYPDLFAAVAPLSSGGAWQHAGQLKSVPVWVFHNTEDKIAPISGVRNTVRAIQQLGGKIALTETSVVEESDHHDCWTVAFRDYHLTNWLLAQKRGSKNAPDPGDLSLGTRWRVLRGSILAWSTLWPRLAAISVVVVVAWAIRREVGKTAT